MPVWIHQFQFSVGDRVKVTVPDDIKAIDKTWASFDGRYGTVGKFLFESQHTGTLFLSYRIDLDKPPRGKSRTLWCKEHFLRMAKEGKDAK